MTEISLFAPLKVLKAIWQGKLWSIEKSYKVLWSIEFDENLIVYKELYRNPGASKQWLCHR